MVAEGVVESRSKDQHVRCEHAPRVVGHHQRAAGLRDVLDVSHLGAKPPFDQRPERVGHLFGECRIPFGGLVIVGCGARDRLHNQPPCLPVLVIVRALAAPARLYAYRAVRYSQFARMSCPPLWVDRASGGDSRKCHCHKLIRTCLPDRAGAAAPRHLRCHETASRRLATTAALSTARRQPGSTPRRGRSRRR